MPSLSEWISKKRRPQQPQGSRLIEELREVRRQLDGIRSYFALETDDDLLDAAIYLREALEARQRYLLRLAKEQNAVAWALPVTVEKERWIN